MSNLWSADRLFSDVEKLDELSRSLEPYLIDVIQELSGVVMSEREVIRLAGFWLLHFVHRIYGIVEGIEERMGTQITDGCETLTIEVPHDRRQEMNSTLGDLEFRSTVEQLVFMVWKLEAVPEGVLLKKRTEDEESFNPRRMVNARFEAIRQPLSRGAQIWIGHPYVKISRLDLFSSQVKSRKWAKWVPSDLAFDSRLIEIKESVRLELAKCVGGSNFSALLRRLLPLMLPFGYSEGLPHYRKLLLRQLPDPPRVLHSAIGLQIDHWHQVAASVWGELGTLITTHQHGGHSGLDERHVLEDFEVRISDRYYSFGWTDSRGSISPLPIPSPRRVPQENRPRVLLMSLESTEFVYRLQPFAMPIHFKLCFSETQSFIESIDDRGNLVARCGEQDCPRLRLREFNVGWESLRGSGTESAARSKLVVHNYFGASWLETLAMNIPTVCFVPAGIHRFRVAAQPFVEALARVGVIHYSGKDAAKFVNSFHGDPSAWWRSAEVQEAREAFVARYANFSDNWLEAWQEEFESLLAE